MSKFDEAKQALPWNSADWEQLGKIADNRRQSQKNTEESAEMQAAIRELRELLDQHTDPMNRLPIIDQALNNTKKWSKHEK